MKVIAHYLPQFHEFEPNSTWWGKGFTEWTCVNRGYSTHPEHRIKKPHSDIGYYCLLDVEIRRLQAILAKRYSVYGFCYYHYWFGDCVLMDAPLKLMLQDGQPDLPFCFSWANEPWTRRMNGGDGELLQPANYGDDHEWVSHLEYLLPFFRHPNYICVQNKPMFVIYRVSQIPNARQRFAFWNEALKKEGFDGIFLVMTIGNFQDDYRSMSSYVDAALDFHPNFLWHSDMILEARGNIAYYDMSTAYERILRRPVLHDVHFRGTMVGFDSSPRSPKRSNVFINGSPALFGDHLMALMGQTKQEFVFVNAWNEWGEGAVLEPEEVDGYNYLEQIRRVVGLRRLI